MDNDAERKSMMSRPIPARPKGVTGPTAPMDFRRQFMPEESAEEPVLDLPSPVDAFSAFAEVMTILRKQPKATRKQIVTLIAELLTE